MGWKRRSSVAVVGLVTMLTSVMLATPHASGEIAATSTVDTVAGGMGYGRATRIAQFPRGLALSGDLLYMTETSAFQWRDVSVVRALDLRTGNAQVVAGNGRRALEGDNVPGTEASIGLTGGAAVAADGSIYFVDRYRHEVRALDSSGVITTVAGRRGTVTLNDGGPATEAGLLNPTDIAVDGQGNLFIADTYHHRIRRVDAATGVIKTVVGSGQAGFTGDGGPAAVAQLHRPTSVAVDSNGVLYIADFENRRVRRVDANGIITTFAGGGQLELGTEAAATEVALAPYAVEVDPSGTLYLSDSYRVRKVGADGVIRTVAGDGTSSTRPSGGTGFSGEGMPALEASIDAVNAMVFGPNGELYVADAYRVRRIDATGTIVTVAGNGELTVGGDGGPPTRAQLNEPQGITFDRLGNLYIADRYNGRVRKVTPSGVMSTIAGTTFAGNSGGDGGPATSATLQHPSAVAVDDAGNVYVTETFRVRRIDSSGRITTFAGAPYPTEQADGGPATSANLHPSALAFDGDGNLYIGTSDRVRRVDKSGVITTVAGPGPPAEGIGDGGPATQASVGPMALEFDSEGRLVILDKAHDRLRRVDRDGIITTIAGNSTTVYDRGFAGDGGPAVDAELFLGDRPGGLAVDAFGNIFIADTGNSRVRKVDTAGIIATVAGSGEIDFSGDGGSATDAKFDVITDLALDASGNLFLSDSANRRIRRITGIAGPPAAPPKTPTIAPPPAAATLQVPYSVWTQPGSAPLDGVATWVAAVNEPTAAAGQAPPDYLNGLMFSFASAPATGVVALTSGPTGKQATFSAVGSDGVAHTVAVPLNWSAGQFYLPFVYRLGSGTWGAWVYDHSASKWVGIGVLDLPPSWGNLSTATVTFVQWLGAPQSDCAAYPKADVFFHPVIGFAGSSATVANLHSSGAGAGRCAGRTSIENGVWARYQLGV